jgi:hypothetical protein
VVPPIAGRTLCGDSVGSRGHAGGAYSVAGPTVTDLHCTDAHGAPWHEKCASVQSKKMFELLNALHVWKRMVP